MGLFNKNMCDFWGLLFSELNDVWQFHLRTLLYENKSLFGDSRCARFFEGEKSVNADTV